MKPIQALMLVVLLAGCASPKGDFSRIQLPPALPPEKDFVQGNIRITPPVTLQRLPNGEPDIRIANDGGTTGTSIRDAQGRLFDVIIDHKMGTPTPGAIYLWRPGQPNLRFDPFPYQNWVRVLREDEFRHTIGDFDVWPPSIIK
jgi:hypothetical protein